MLIIYSIATLVGTIVGVGMFGLPYVSSQAGFGLALFYFAILSVLAIIMHLIYGEIALRTRGQHRLCGYAETYLGKWGKEVTLVSNIFSFYGALFAYVVIGGKFLFLLLNPYFGGVEIVYSLIFFLAGSILIFRGIKSIARTEFWMLLLFFVILVILGFYGADKIHFSNLVAVNFDNVILPYGVIVFSLWGTSIIPELKDMLKGRERKLKTVIVSGILISVLTYLYFIILVHGISGAAATKEGLSGLVPYLGKNALVAAFLFGILTTFTSFLTLGLTLEKTFRYDFEIKHLYSWTLTICVPLLLVLMGFMDFIRAIGIVGAIGLAFETFVLLLIHRKAKNKGQLKPAYSIGIPKIIFYVIIILVSFGALAEIFLG